MIADPTEPASIERQALISALRRVAAGDRLALREVYRRTSAKLFAICLRICPERADAEDVLQDVYLSVWKRADTYDAERASPITWLVTMTRNRAIDKLRASGRRPSAPLDFAKDVADETPDAEMVLAASGESRRIETCIETLATSESVMIRSAFFDGATYNSIAERAGMPLSTVKSRVRRALIKLRDCLQ